MRPGTKRSLRARRNESPAESRRQVTAQEARDLRAQRRFHLARFVREATGSLKERQRAVIAAVREPEGVLHEVIKSLGEDPADFSISHETVRAWMRREHDDVSVEGLSDHYRPGRPAAPMPEAIERFFKDAVLAARFPSARSLWLKVCELATEHSVVAPSYNRIKRAYNAIPHGLHVAARHGKAAVIADATVHSTPGAQVPHEFWALDEATLPVWVKVYVNSTRTFLATKVDAVLVIDLASEVIVGYHIANPILRGVMRGVDSEDVLGAVASALFPELSTDACRPYAGFLPGTLRYDRGGQHHDTGARLAKLGVDVPHLPGYAPWRNGAVESAVGAIKGLCSEIVGYDEKWAVAEYEQEEGHRRRRKIAATMSRLPTYIPVTIDQLLSVQQLRGEFESVIRRYNRELEHSHWGITRESRYYETFDQRKTRSGRDALTILDTTRVTVQDRGLVVKGVPYAVQAAHVALAINETVTVRIDPLMRGVFVERDGVWVCLPPMADWARSQHPADIAKAQNATALEYSRLAREARERYQEDALGAEGAAIANAVARETLSAESARRKKAAKPSTTKTTTIPAAAMMLAPRRQPERKNEDDLRDGETDAPLAPAPVIDPPPLRLVAGGGGGAAPAPRGIARRPISLVRPSD